MALASLLPLIQPNLLQCPIGPIDTCRSLPSSPIIKLGQASTALAMLIASESMTPTPTQAMINNISVAPSNAWYFSLTPFESILLGLIVLKLMLLRYVTVLPISINDLANKDYFNFGKKRKRDLQEQFDESKIKKEKERLAEIMFTVIRRLDMQDCFLRMLCELQAHSLRGKALPREVKLTLSALSKSGWNRKQEKKPDLGPDFIEERPILSVFEEAVQVGWDAKGGNSTECMERYFICPLTTEDLFAHFDTVKVVDVL